MAPKKKTQKKNKKKQSKPKKALKKAASSKVVARKKATSSKVVAKKKATPKKAAPKKTLASKKGKGRGRSEQSVSLDPKKLRARRGGKSGDVQGIPEVAGAATESMDELLEDGTVFEVEIVEGVEDVTDADLAETKSSEPPEDDIPEEY